MLICRAVRYLFRRISFLCSSNSKYDFIAFSSSSRETGISFVSIWARHQLAARPMNLTAASPTLSCSLISIVWYFFVKLKNKSTWYLQTETRVFSGSPSYFGSLMFKLRAGGAGFGVWASSSLRPSSFELLS